MIHPWCSHCPYRPPNGGACPRAVAGSTWCRWGGGRFQVCPSSGADKGGQGSVCDAVFNGVPVKVKWTETGSYDIAQSYRGEVAALRLLADTGIVPRVFSDVEEDPLPNGKRAVFYAMETAPGAPWGDGRGRLAFGRAYRLPLFRLVECMLRMHERRVSHLDLKPQNLFFDPAGGRVTVIDFGTAKGAGRISRATGFGVDPYLPLEQQVGDILWPTVGETSDDFACGVLFVQAVMGLSTSDLDAKYMEAMPHPRFPGRTVKRYADAARASFRRAIGRTTGSDEVARLVVDGLLADKPFDSATGRETAPDPRQGILLRLRDELARLGWGEGVPQPPLREPPRGVPDAKSALPDPGPSLPRWLLLLAVGVVLCGVVGGVVAWVNRAGGSSDGSGNLPPPSGPGSFDRVVVGEKTDKDAKQPQSLTETYNELLRKENGRADVLSQMKLDWDNPDLTALRREIWEYYCTNATLLPVLDVPTNLNFSSHSNEFAGVFQGHVSSKDNRLFFVPNKDKIPATNVSEAVGSLALRFYSSDASEAEQDCDQCTKTIRVSVPLFGNPGLKDSECELEVPPHVSVQVEPSYATVEYRTGSSTAGSDGWNAWPRDRNRLDKLRVRPHQIVTIRVSADGYKSQTKTLDSLHRGQDETVEISLVRERLPDPVVDPPGQIREPEDPFLNPDSGSETPQENPWTTWTNRLAEDANKRVSVLKEMSEKWSESNTNEEGRKAIWAFYCAHSDLWPILSIDTNGGGGLPSLSSRWFTCEEISPREGQWRLKPTGNVPDQNTVGVTVPFRAGDTPCETCDKKLSQEVPIFATNVTEFLRPSEGGGASTLSLTISYSEATNRVPGSTSVSWRYENDKQSVPVSPSGDGSWRLAGLRPHSKIVVEIQRNGFLSQRPDFDTSHAGSQIRREVTLQRDSSVKLPGDLKQKMFVPAKADDYLFHFRSDSSVSVMNFGGGRYDWTGQDVAEKHDADKLGLAMKPTSGEVELWRWFSTRAPTLHVGSADGLDLPVQAVATRSDVTLKSVGGLADGEWVSLGQACAVTKDECKDILKSLASTDPAQCLQVMNGIRTLKGAESAWDKVCKEVYEIGELKLNEKSVDVKGVPKNEFGENYKVTYNGASGTLFSVSVPYGKTEEMRLTIGSCGCYEPVVKPVSVSWTDRTKTVSITELPKKKESPPTWTIPAPTGRYRMGSTGMWEDIPQSERERTIKLEPHRETTVEVWDWNREEIFSYSLGGPDMHCGDKVSASRPKSSKKPAPGTVKKWLTDVSASSLGSLEWDIWEKPPEMTSDAKSVDEWLDSLSKDPLYSDLGKEVLRTRATLQTLSSKDVNAFLTFCTNKNGFFDRMGNLPNRTEFQKYADRAGFQKGFEKLFQHYFHKNPTNSPEDALDVLNRFKNDIDQGTYSVPDGFVNRLNVIIQKLSGW